MEHTVSPQAVADAVRRVVEADERIVTAYLFGSYGRGTPGSGSDIDLAVLFREKVEPQLGGPLAELRDALERATGIPCDVIDAEQAPVDLVKRIFRDGELLLDRDKSKRIRFEVAKRNEYWDLLPYLNEYRRKGRAR